MTVAGIGGAFSPYVNRQGAAFHLGHVKLRNCVVGSDRVRQGVPLMFGRVTLCNVLVGFVTFRRSTLEGKSWDETRRGRV